jgi:hypothetical protein
MNARPVTPCTECLCVAHCSDALCQDDQRLHVLTDKVFNAAIGMPNYCVPCGEAFDDRRDLERHVRSTQHLRLIEWIKGHRFRRRYCDTCRRIYTCKTSDARRAFDDHKNRLFHRSRAKIRRLHRSMRMYIHIFLPRASATLPSTNHGRPATASSAIIDATQAAPVRT